MDQNLLNITCIIILVVVFGIIVFVWKMISLLQSVVSSLYEYYNWTHLQDLDEDEILELRDDATFEVREGFTRQERKEIVYSNKFWTIVSERISYGYEKWKNGKSGFWSTIVDLTVVKELMEVAEWGKDK